MTLADELAQINSIFIDTAPVIYFIEAHSQFGPLAKEVVAAFQSGKLKQITEIRVLVLQDYL